MLIEKTNGNISEIDISKVKDTGMLIKAIANNCPKIEKLAIYPEYEDFIHIKLLLLNCRQLKCLELSNSDYISIPMKENGDELLDILAKFSPNSLTEITFYNMEYSIDVLEQFLESCRERTLHYFGINRCTKDHVEIVRKYIKEGVILKFKHLLK